MVILIAYFKRTSYIQTNAKRIPSTAPKISNFAILHKKSFRCFLTNTLPQFLDV